MGKWCIVLEMVGRCNSPYLKIHSWVPLKISSHQGVFFSPLFEDFSPNRELLTAYAIWRLRANLSHLSSIIFTM